MFYPEKEEKYIAFLKTKNDDYLKELQCFLDKVSNIEKEELKEELVIHMLKCEKILTDILAEGIIF